MDPLRKMLLHPVFALTALALGACGSSASTPAAYVLPGLDATSDGGAPKDSVSKADLAATLDVTAADDASSDEEIAATDAVVANTAPQLLPIADLKLDQGASATVDFGPLLWDSEDATATLKLTWSAKHVALKDSGAHALYVVAPTTWSGTEAIDFTVTDSGGLSATATWQVTVKEVQVSTPVPTSDCGTVAFSIDAGKGQHTVLLSGSFNGWAATADKADVLKDVAGNGTWSIDKKLAAGVYQYKFIVDGKWMADKSNPNQVPDGYGGTNSVIEVAACKP